MYDVYICQVKGVTNSIRDNYLLLATNTNSILDKKVFHVETFQDFIYQVSYINSPLLPILFQLFISLTFSSLFIICQVS